MADTITTPLAVSIEEAARRAGVGRGYLYQQISKGKLRARKAGRRTIIALRRRGVANDPLHRNPR
jgi:excisionase family DNA binding protein